MSNRQLLTPESVEVAELSACLTADQLRGFLLGRTDEQTSELIAAHLAACASCEDTISTLEDTVDSLVVSLREERREQASVAGLAPTLASSRSVGNGSSAGDESGDDGMNSGGELEPSDGSNAVLAAALSNVRSRFPEPPVGESLDGRLLDGRSLDGRLLDGRSLDGRSLAEAERIVERIRDYELLEKLGAGGMGTVYRAVHTRLERVVALKLLPARKLRDGAAVGRFEREMKAIGRLNHPAIVRATDAGEVDGTHFLAMDLVDGIDLARLVRHSGPLDVASACEVVRQAAIGLDYAHQQGLIHRDVKPSNLMLDRDGTVRILDLGLALFGAASEAVDELTTVGQLMGTLDYMAPEQADNSHEVDARADVYSLGATLFKLLTGATVYEAPDRRTPLSRMRALATLDAPSITTRRDDLPTGLVELIDGMLSREPASRPASAAEVAEALTGFCEGPKLAELAEGFGKAEGRELRAEGEALSPFAPRKDAFATRSFAERKATMDDAPRSRVTQNAGDRTSNGRSGMTRVLTNIAAAGIVFFAGIMLWLQTNNGTLLIEADESVPIEIRRVGNPAQHETLKVGQNSLTIRSGEYEIVLPKEYDSLKVENGKFELLRGGTWIARVTKQPDTPVLASSSTRPERISASESVLPSPAPSSNDPFAPPFPSNDSFAPLASSAGPARQAEPATAQTAPQNLAVNGTDIPFGLQTTAWRINQKLIRTGATKPVELRPQSIVGLIHQLVSYKHSAPQHPYPAFAMFRTAHDVEAVLNQPGFERCVGQSILKTTRHDHTQQVGPLVGPLNNGEVRATASDGRLFTLTLSPEFHESGQVSLKLNVNRQPGDEAGATAVGDVPVGVPATQDFVSNRLAFGETLIVTELDPLADEIILFEIHPVRPVPTQRANPFVSSARPTTRTPFDPEPEIPQPSLVSGRDVPLHLETEVWQINQAAYRAGTTGLPLVEPRSASGVVAALLRHSFTIPTKPANPPLDASLKDDQSVLPATTDPTEASNAPTTATDNRGKRWAMFRTEYDVRQRLTTFPFTGCVSRVLPEPLASNHDHVRQVGPLTGPLSSHQFPIQSASGAGFTIKLTPELLEDKAETVSLDLRLVRSGIADPQEELLRLDSLRWDDTILLLEIEPAAKAVSLLLIRPQRPATDASAFTPPTASSPRTGNSPPTATIPGSGTPRPTMSRTIPPGMRVVPVLVDRSRSVVGLLHAGDRVDVLAVRQKPTGSGVMAETVAESLEVFSPHSNQPVDEDRRAVLLLATAEQARAIKLAAEEFQIHIVLQSRGSSANRNATPDNTTPDSTTPDSAATPGSVPEDRREIPTGMRVVNVTVDLTGIGDGLLSPGARVDLLATLLLQTETGTTRQVKPVAEFLEVFAVESGGVTATGPATSGVTASGPAPGSHRTVSLVVTPDQARVIKLAEFVGQLHIVLRARDAEPTMIPSDLTALEKLLSGPGEMPTRSQPEPVFSGKTFDEWELVVLTERNPDDLKTAVEAFGRLGRGGRDVEAAETIFRILAPYDPELIAGARSGRQPLSGESSLLMAAMSQLRRLDPDAVTQVIIRIMPDASDNTRRLILEQVAASNAQQTLRERLAKSPQFLATVTAAWPKLDEVNQQFAFDYLTHCERSGEMGADLNRFLSQLTHQPESNLFIPAIRTLCEISPDNIGELPAILLDFLETPDDPGSGVAAGAAPQQWPTWLVREHDAWLGLAALKEHAAPYAARIAELLTKADGKIEGRGIDAPVAILLRDHSSGQTSNSHASVTKRQLIYELLGRLGPLAAGQVPLLIELPSKYFAAKPDPTGDYEFVAAHQEFVLDTLGFPVFGGASSGSFGAGGAGATDFMTTNAAQREKSHSDSDARARNSLIFALQRINGHPLRFGDVGIVSSDPRNGPDNVMAGAFVDLGASRNHFVPVLVNYQRKTFREWLDFKPTTPEERRSQVRGLTVLARDAQEEDAARLFGVLTTTLRTLLETEDFWKDGACQDTVATQTGYMAAQSLAVFRDELLTTTLVNEFLSGPDRARVSILRCFASPEYRDHSINWPMSVPVSELLDRSNEFQDAFDALLKDTSDDDPEVLRAAIGYAVRRPASRESISIQRLTPLLRPGDHPQQTEAAIAVARLLEAQRFGPAVSRATMYSRATANPPESLTQLVGLRLLAALKETPSDIEFLDVALALRTIAERHRDTTFAEQLMTLLEQECQTDKISLRQLKLVAPPAGVPLLSQDSKTTTPPGQLVAALLACGEQPRTISRRTIVAGLLLHALAISVPAERAPIDERARALAQSVSKRAGGEPTVPIERVRDSRPSMPFLWPLDSDLSSLSDALKAVWLSEHPGTRLNTEPGGDAEQESEDFRQLLGLLLRQS